MGLLSSPIAVLFSDMLIDIEFTITVTVFEAFLQELELKVFLARAYLDDPFAA